MFRLYRDHLIKLINEGKVTLEGIQYMYNQGFCTVCADGKCINIYEDIDFE